MLISPQMNIKSQIPNVITLGNLLCGAFSVYFVTQNNLALAALLILAGAFLDFFDGMSARLLKVSGELGKQLDSLADLISFGLAPAFIAMHFAGAFANDVAFSIWAFTPVIIAPFAAYRLAKFNIDTRQTSDFIGMATPSNALFWLSIPLILAYSNTESGLGTVYLHFSESVLAVNIAAVFISILMVSEIRFFSLKFNSLKWSGNEFRYVLILSSIILLFVFHVQALPIILLLYFILSLIYHFTRK